MASSLGNNWVDKLLAPVDTIRGKINTAAGTRPWRVFMVVRTYNGNRQDGYYSEASTELLPAPRVDVLSDNQYAMTGAGKYSKGDIKVSELSLNYSEEQIHLLANTQQNIKCYLRLVDAHGQNKPDRIFVAKEIPIADRDHTIGWIVFATEKQLENLFNGVR